LKLTGSDLSRQPWVKTKYRRPDYIERFDSETLWLDAVWYKDKVILVMPRLNNLWRRIQGAMFFLDGKRVNARLRTYYRHSFVCISTSQVPKFVSIKIGDWTAETPVHQESHALDGRNVLFTLSKDNDPKWIEDWARFHRVNHAADAVLFVDNGSQYGTKPIAEALSKAGFKDPLIMNTTVPYGPRGKAPFANSELFLQTGVMNACRFRFLRGARAVLAIDVDELIISQGGSIFDRAVNSRMGYVTAPGRWVYPKPETDSWVGHDDHTWRDDPPKPCPGKWCIVPNGPLRQFSWRVHKLERLPFSRFWEDRNFGLLHCHALTTGWKRTAITAGNRQLVKDQEAIAALSATGLSSK
jgi:hypothetical protein